MPRLGRRALPRRALIFVLPVAAVYLAWGLYMSASGSWGLFGDRWYMTLTMVFGSFIAGASPEGGGAVAYPVMTLVFDIAPDIARNFSLLIQSIGMTAASLWILARGVRVETTYLWLAMAGGTVGVVAATYLVAPLVQPAYAKMMFVSFWLSFGIALFVFNHLRRRPVYESLPRLDRVQKAELVAIGFLGGVLSAIFGNGIDICTFSYVTLRYGLSEKVATPTSVVLMASNAVVGAVLHGAVLGDVQPAAFAFWMVCIPVVMLGAPFGAYVVTRINRLAIAVLLYAIIAVQFVAALIIVKPSVPVLAVSALTFGVGMTVFFLLTLRRPSRPPALSSAAPSPAPVPSASRPRRQLG